MRNLSKNTLKRLIRPLKNGAVGYAYRDSNYFFHNHGGAKAWTQSNGKINTLDGMGCAKYLTRPQQIAWAKYWDL